jgi:hypothetical protein
MISRSRSSATLALAMLAAIVAGLAVAIQPLLGKFERLRLVSARNSVLP